MGDVNQLAWVKAHEDRVQAPILEIGSKIYSAGVSMDYRSRYADRGLYLGIDMQPGDGVDLVADLTTDPRTWPEPLRSTKFRTIICMSVMEHVRDVYRFAANLKQLLAEDGTAFISVPWVWRFHGYPSDYWRFSPEALKFLFEPLALDEKASCVSYQPAGEVTPLTAQGLSVYPDYDKDVAPPPAKKGAIAALRAVCGKLFPAPARGRRQVLYPTMINAAFARAA